MSELKIHVNICSDPKDQGTFSSDVCWRCGGKGVVNVTDEETTPCGACLGIVAPLPCPKCGANKAKLALDGSSVYWHCRECGHEGPGYRVDEEALRAWNKEAGIRR